MQSVSSNVGGQKLRPDRCRGQVEGRDWLGRPKYYFRGRGVPVAVGDTPDGKGVTLVHCGMAHQVTHPKDGSNPLMDCMAKSSPDALRCHRAHPAP